MGQQGLRGLAHKPVAHSANNSSLSVCGLRRDWEIAVDSAAAPWTALPAARQAAAERRYGALVRLARTAADLTLAEAGRRVGYSASALSRIERGHQPLTDITVLRRLA